VRRFCDITLSYNKTSGGIRTYLDQKRKYLLEHTDIEHVLIIPGDEDSVEQGERWTTYTIASPLIPGHAPYRMFWRPDKIKSALVESRPDYVELGSFYVSPWAAFSYRSALLEDGQTCIIGAYFHTDFADAYVGTPLRTALGEALGNWGDVFESLGLKLADAAESGAEKYIHAVMDRCVLRMAASPAQVQRLHEYNIDHAHVVPLGVDLERFHPKHRTGEIRARYGADDNDLILMYAGRLEHEKRVHLLIDAFERLPDELRPCLLILGEGPLREELEQRAKDRDGIHVLPYESDPDAFAAVLASADIYVTAGPHETFGLSVVEAQASGLPVVGVNSGALTERVTEGLGFLGPVDDADAMAENISKAAAQRQEIGRRAREHVEQTYGWSSTFGRLIELYDDCGKLQRHALPSDQRTLSGH